MVRKPVWISRPVLNVDDIYRWGEEAGVQKMMPPDQIHATLATVREPVDWSNLVAQTDEMVVPAGGMKTEIFAYTIKALAFEHAPFRARHTELLKLLPTMDHPRLRPHVSLYKGGRMPKMPYPGILILGPERIVEFDAANTTGVKHVKLRDMLQ